MPLLNSLELLELTIISGDFRESVPPVTTLPEIKGNPRRGADAAG
jgi:hypothetical protein